MIQQLQDAFWIAADALLMGHTNPWELDEALVDAGYSLGPCEAQDLCGLDVVSQRLSSPALSPVVPRMVAEGRLGKKVGWGYYRYPGGGGAVIDPLIEDLIREEAWFAGKSRSDIPETEIVAHMDKALVGAVLQAVSSGARTADVMHAAQQAVHLPYQRILGLLAAHQHQHRA